MSYSADTFVADEQPTTAKWNKLWNNDASFNDGTGIADDAILARHINWDSTGANAGIWWEELGRTTLGSAGDTITVSSLPNRKYLRILLSYGASGNTDANLRFNGDTGNNYASRYTIDDTGGSATSTNVIVFRPGLITTGGYALVVADILNIASTAKFVAFMGSGGSTSAGTAPTKIEGAGKWSNTTDAISSITAFNNNTGDFAIGSELVVLGHN